MRIFIAAFVLIFFMSNTTFAQQENDLKQYYLVLLKKGANRTQSVAEAEKIQTAHLANMDELAKQNKLHIAGPVAADLDLRGIFILNVPTLKEAEEILQADLAIKSGRLKYEIYPWLSQPGNCLK